MSQSDIPSMWAGSLTDGTLTPRYIRRHPVKSARFGCKGLAGYLSPEFVTMLYVEDNSDETSGLLKARGFVPFNSRQLWIDELRHQRFSECVSTFFESGRHGCRKNALWCAKLSSVERFMSERLEALGRRSQSGPGDNRLALTP